MRSFGRPDQFALAYRFDPFSETEPSASAYLASEGRLQVWAGGLNLCRLDGDPPAKFASHGSQALYDHLFPYVEWLVFRFRDLFQDRSFPLPLEAASAAEFSSKCREHLREAPDSEAEGIGEVLGDWFQTRCLAAGTDGGFPPEVFFRGLGSEIEISWDSYKVRPYQGHCGYKHLRGRFCVDKPSFHETLTTFIQAFLKELRGRHLALREDPMLLPAWERARRLPSLVELGI